MKFSVQRETLLKPLQAVMGVVERRQTMPILANVLLRVREGRIVATATDLEVELAASAEVDMDEAGEITVPGRKLLDICRALPEGAQVKFARDGDRVTVRSGRSRFMLSSLAAGDFPVVEDVNPTQTLTLPAADVGTLLDKTHFSMAHQDVRYYLNGLLIEVDGQTLRTVATDGHRLALCEVALPGEVSGKQQVILPRKGVLELHRLLGGTGELTMEVGSNHLRVDMGEIRFTSKLIDGRFPDYDRVIPADAPDLISADRALLRQALHRASILSNEKYRGIRLELGENKMLVQAHNPEQEEAEEEIEVQYSGVGLEIGFNVNYLMDALGAVEGEQVELSVTDANSSCLVREPGRQDCKYVVMPMRL